MPPSHVRQNVPTVIEEWPEMMDATVGEVKTVQTDLQKSPPQKIRLGSICSEDLPSLKRKDPFLYYSIPGVRSAKLLGQDIDAMNLGTCKIRSCLLSRVNAWQPARGEARSRPANETERKSCLSFECHPDLLLDELLLDELLPEEEDEDLDLEDAEDSADLLENLIDLLQR